LLLELAVGDAYGAGFEYVDRDAIRVANDLSQYVKHPRHNIPPGWYTDDTQMSIAIAEALVSGKPWTPRMLADKFVEAFKRDPREGYAERFYEFLTRVQDGRQFLAEIQPTSDKSGAAMRAAPIGVLRRIEDVIDRTTVQARVTHDTPDGINAAVAAALMTHYFVHDRGPKQELGAFLDTHVAGQWSLPWQGKVKSKGWMSVRAAVTSIVSNHTMSALLRHCISFSGDVDTVAAIALAAGSCSREIEQDLPGNLVALLENRKYGREYLIELDAQVMQLKDSKG
jgi:ADP-ribosyl-[dinitrogen reductase] hydrolase